MNNCDVTSGSPKSISAKQLAISNATDRNPFYLKPNKYIIMYGKRLYDSSMQKSFAPINNNVIYILILSHCISIISIYYNDMNWTHILVTFNTGFHVASSKSKALYSMGQIEGQYNDKKNIPRLKSEINQPKIAQRPMKAFLKWKIRSEEWLKTNKQNTYYFQFVIYSKTEYRKGG